MPASVQRVAVEADAGDPPAFEVGAEPAERVRVAVDDGDGVALGLQDVGEGGADPATAHDHEVHVLPPMRAVAAARVHLHGRA